MNIISFKLAFRNILKNRINSIITLVGLSVAFACVLLIYLYVSQEFNFNTFHSNCDKIFRVDYSLKHLNGEEISSVYLDPKLSEVLKAKVTQIKRSTAFRSAHGPSLIFENHNFETNVYITESDFFDMFSFKLLAGIRDELFKNPDEIVISSTLAKKLQAIKSCTKEELLGQMVLFNRTGNQPFTIKGIFEELPKNSSLQFDALIPFKYESAFSQSNNMFGNSELFYELNSSKDAQLAAKNVSNELKKYYKSRIEERQAQEILANTTEAFSPHFTPLNELYLSTTNSDYEKSNSKKALFILSAIALLILVIACSNFILLSLGQTFKKMGEVGIRKIMGAGRVDIFNLIFTEGLIVTFAALVLGAVLCYFLIPVFNQLAGNEIYRQLINFPRIIVFAISCVLLVVLTTSAIPVLKLTKINPGQLASKTLNSGNRKVTRLFVTTQYILSIFLIIMTISIVRQTNHMKYKSLGFSSENIMNIKVYQLNNGEKLALRDKLKSFSGVENLTLTDRDFVDGRSSDNVQNQDGENILVRTLKVDKNYIPTLGLKIIQGENFNENNSGPESNLVIINEKMLTQLNANEAAVGQILKMYGRSLQVAGVVKDFHYDSMKEEIEPLLLMPVTASGERGNFIFLKYNPTQLAEVIPFIKTSWNEIAPANELDLSFWDKQLNDRYYAEEKWSKIIGYAAIIAIIISSLGLFGFTLIIINNRIKEIGIRKVNGAKISEILVLLNHDFVKWVAIAFVIATPIAWYSMNKWLENFAYKTELSWWIFALAGVLALGVALLTVSFQSWKAATRNPVESLRYE